MRSARSDVRLVGPPEADGEYVALGGAGDEELVHLHDYDRLYATPGLYEHIVGDLLECRSPQVAVDGLMRALALAGLAPEETVVLDLGAGTGLVAELARARGVAELVGLDFLESARIAAARDRPGAYVDYLVGDLAAEPPDRALLDALRRRRPHALVAAGALGGTHMPPLALHRAAELLRPGAPVVFTIDERWTATDEPGGFRTPLARMFATGELEVHRARVVPAPPPDDGRAGDLRAHRRDDAGVTWPAWPTAPSRPSESSAAPASARQPASTPRSRRAYAR